MAYTEKDPPTDISATLAVTDVDNTTLASATVTIAGNYQNGQDVLGFANTLTITGSWNPATATLTLSGIDTLVNYQAALRSVTYVNTSDNPSALTRTVKFRANDGTLNSGPVSRTITVTPVDDPPVLGGIESAPLAYTEKNPPMAITAGLTVSDVDNTTLVGATVTITGNYQNGQDVLGFVNTGSITGSWNATSGTLTLTGTDTLADYQAALRSVTYVNTSANPSSLNRTVAFMANDGTLNGSPVIRTITVTPVDDPPVLSAIESAPLVYLVKAPSTTITGTLALSDVDNTTLCWATVTISGNYQNGQDVLAFANTATIIGNWNAATATLTLTGTDTVANYQAALRSVTYVNTSSGPSSLTRTVTFAANDGTLTSNLLSRTITITMNHTGFDFGISGSAVRSGYVGVLPTTTYTASQGYGWLAAVQGRDRGTLSGTTMSNLLQSMNFGQGTSSPGTLEIDGLPVGATYDVTVTLGDTYAANATVTLPTGYGTVVSGGANVTNVSTAAGVYVNETFTVTPNASGRLQLQFSTTSSSTMWVVDGIAVRPTVAGATLTGPSGMLGGDGTTVDTFSQTGLTPGDVYTVSTTLGSMVTPDADSRYAGTQVIVDGTGTLTFQVRRPSGAGTATVMAQEVEGKAWASATVTYYAPASVSLASSKGSDTYGDSVTFTATVAGTNNATPGGRVELYIDGVDTQQSAAVSGSGSTATAAFTLSNLSAGTHAVTVAYSGDGVNYPSGTSNAVTQTVGKKTLTVSATGVNRSYDGTTTATVTLSDNRVSGDPLTESYTSASFANADAGNGIAVNVTGISVTGSAAGNYVLGNTTATTTANIIPAALSYTIGSDSQSYGSAANLAKDLPGTITTGVNGENLSIAYASTGDTGTAHAGTYAITGTASNGTGLASNYAVSLTSGTLTVSAAGFDYGISGSAVRSGYVGVLPTTTYTASQGYGWLAAVQGRDRGTLSGTTMSNLLQSMNFGVGTSSPGTFEFDGLAAGVNYDVTVTLGDTYAANATVTLPTGYGTVVSGGANVTNVSTAAGVYVNETFTVTPNASGRLQLQFSTTSSSTMWAVDGIAVRPTVAGGTLTGPSGMLGGDGTTVDTFSQTGLTPGDVYTISTTLGSMVTPDADSRYAGTQVIVDGTGTLTFQVRRPSGAGTATVMAQEVEGKAWASATVIYQALGGPSASAPDTAERGPKVAAAAAPAVSLGGAYTPAATVNMASSGDAGGKLGAVTDNKNGTYSATYTAGTKTGTETIGATIGGKTVSSKGAVTVVSGPANLPSSTMVRSQIGSGSSVSPALGRQFTNDRVVDAALQALLLDESTVTGKPRAV